MLINQTESKLVGILENLEPNHVQTLKALVKSYALIPNVKIIAFVSHKTFNELKGLGLERLTEFVIQNESQSNLKFLFDIVSFTQKRPLHRLHICSTKEYFRDFSKFLPKTKEIVLHIHNTNVWFQNNLKHHLDTLIFDLKNDRSGRKKLKILGKFFKNISYTKYYTKRIVDNYKRNYNLKFIVQNSNIAKTIPSDYKEIMLFPFSCFAPEPTQSNDQNTTQKTGSLKIGICGMVSQERRDYLGLFEALKRATKPQKDSLEFKLLGYTNPREKEVFKKEISNLQSLGIKITLPNETNTSIDYQQSMEQCDILLNLVRVQKGAHSIYSKTKESGAIGDMISSAKPGLIPKNYFIETTFKKSTLEFQDMEHLLALLEDLILNPQKLNSLKQEAINASINFTPEKLCKIIKIT